MVNYKGSGAKMKWKEDNYYGYYHGLPRYRMEYHGIVAEVTQAIENGVNVARLEMHMDIRYAYSSTAVSTVAMKRDSGTSKYATLTTCYMETFDSVDKAKEKAEELVPVFRIAQFIGQIN